MLAAVCVAALAAVMVAAMTLTQSLRKEGPIVSDIRFKVKPEGYRVCFRLPRDEVVEVALVRGRAEELVAVLADDQPLEGGLSDADGDGRRDRANAHCFDWDGTDLTGAPAGPGVYRVRVSLSEAERGGVSGERLRIEAEG